LQFWLFLNRRKDLGLRGDMPWSHKGLSDEIRATEKTRLHGVENDTGCGERCDLSAPAENRAGDDPPDLAQGRTFAALEGAARGSYRFDEGECLRTLLKIDKLTGLTGCTG
jgi:hypothetical protein